MPIPADAAVREFLYSLLDWSQVYSVLDLGCGNGYDLRQIARLAPDECRLVGVDTKLSAVETARAEVRGDKRFAFLTEDAAKALPFEDGEFDVVFSKNMLECLLDKQSHVRDAHRVLRPGGQIVSAHYDWDSQTIDGTDKALVRRIVQTFNDWQQAWMNSCDAWMGRRLWRTFQESGLFQGTMHAQVLTETEYAPGRYGHETINSFSALVRNGMITQAEFDQFLSDMIALAEGGQYFYSITMFAYVGTSLQTAGVDHD